MRLETVQTLPFCWLISVVPTAVLSSVISWGCECSDNSVFLQNVWSSCVPKQSVLNILFILNASICKKHVQSTAVPVGKAQLLKHLISLKTLVEEKWNKWTIYSLTCRMNICNMFNQSVLNEKTPINFKKKELSTVRFGVWT